MRVQYRKDFHMEPNYLVLLGIVIVIIGFALKLDAILIIIVDDHGQRVRRDHRDDRGHRRASCSPMAPTRRRLASSR